MQIREGRKPVNTETLSGEVSTEIAEVMLVVQVGSWLNELHVRLLISAILQL